MVRGWLGVSIADVARDPNTAQSFGYQGTTGVLVEQTFPNTPATSKLQAGDIITEMNGQAVDNVQQLRNSIAATAPDSEVKFKIWRDSKSTEVTVKLGIQPEDLMASIGKGNGPASPQNVAPSTSETLGMTLATPDDQLVQRYGLNDREGRWSPRCSPARRPPRLAFNPAT